jgi:hypothetical protein
VLAKRIPPTALAGATPEELAGAVLLAPVQLIRGTVRKGTRVDGNLGAELIAAARSGSLSQSLRIAWPEASDLHEDDAAERLAAAAGGPGVERRSLRQSRLDLAARWDGVLHVHMDGLTRLNTIDSLELFTLFHGQAVQAGQVVASVKVAPHLVPTALVEAGVRIACEHAPLVEVRPYLALEVAALVAEMIAGPALGRFEAGARTKVEALGSRFAGTTVIASGEPDVAEREARAALESLAIARKLPVILVGGVSAGDPLAPFFAALRTLEGRVVRHGVPAHPGSMIWLAELADSRLLGLPQCGMFTLATAADLILPRLLTGERLTRESLAQLAHGGVLTREMRFRFPAYARDLEAPEG